MVVVKEVVAEMVVAVVVVGVVTMDAIVRSVTNVTKLVISLANARKMLIVVTVVTGLVTLLETAASHQTNRLAIHATELVIWHVIVQTLRAAVVVVVVVIVNAVTVVVVSAVNAVAIMIETCLVTLVTRAVTFHATVQMAPSHATTVAIRDISVVNAPKMVAELKK